MENLLIILAVLGISLLVVVPILQRFSKPLDPNDEEQMSSLAKKGKIMGFLLAFMMLATTIKYFFA